MKRFGARASSARARRPLFRKYFLALFAAVVIPLLVGGASDAWFGYRDLRANLSLRLRAEDVRGADAIVDRLHARLDCLEELKTIVGDLVAPALDVVTLLNNAPPHLGDPGEEFPVLKVAGAQ